MTATNLPNEFLRRIHRMQGMLQAADVDAALITPGASLRYLTGLRGNPDTERITCLVLHASDDPVVVCPLLEEPLVKDSIGLDLEIAAWTETQRPLELIAALLHTRATRVAVDEKMWAARSLALRLLRPQLEQIDAGPLLTRLRTRKSAAEVDALRRAARAIDSVHAEMGEWLRPGRTEREIGTDIADAILQAGHASVEFVIVASGANGSSAHAEVSDRVVRSGDPVVVDIGGTMPDGYNSDSTRTYAIGEPPADFTAYYEVLLAAQRAQCEAVRPGLAASHLDAVGRDIITAGGYGEHFVHRTGHGIGLDVHEDPYIVAGNQDLLEPGMAFSIEPGIYQRGRHGARIEDIVVCTEDGCERLNQRPRELGLLTP